MGTLSTDVKRKGKNTVDDGVKAQMNLDNDILLGLDSKHRLIEEERRYSQLSIGLTNQLDHLSQIDPKNVEESGPVLQVRRAL